MLVDCCKLNVADCMLHVTCHMSHVACWVRHVSPYQLHAELQVACVLYGRGACWMLYVCGVLFATGMLYAALVCCMLYVVCCMLYAPAVCVQDRDRVSEAHQA